MVSADSQSGDDAVVADICESLARLPGHILVRKLRDAGNIERDILIAIEALNDICPGA